MLAEVEEQISALYRLFAVTAPGVQPLEAGRLGQLWQTFDYLVTLE